MTDTNPYSADAKNKATRSMPTRNAMMLSRFPNFHKSGSIIGMKKNVYGIGALLVRCGNYIYNVTSEPSFYDIAV
jgi:hypothetical protein